MPKTLLILAGRTLGVVEEILEVGGVYDIPPFEPLIVRQIIPKPEFKDGQGNIDVDFYAFLHYKEDVAKKHSKKKTSQKLEQDLAKKLGGKTTPGSGAFSFNKGDVKTETFLAEHKYTDKCHYRLQLKTWSKIKNEAFSCTKIPLMEIVLDQEKAPMKIILMELSDFTEIMNIENEDDFIKHYISYPLFSKEKSSSVNLDKEIINKHVNEILSTFEDKIPTLLITFEKINLVGILRKDFLNILEEAK